jgi:hypothetical protein
MADDTQNATLRGRGTNGTRSAVVSTRTSVITATVEVTAAASAASTYTIARLPANARISGLSMVFFDDLASSGSPTLDIGLKAVDSNITTDVDAINDGIDVFTAASSGRLIKDISNYGKMAYEFVNGQTTNPGGFLDLIITILDAATNTGGTITVELVITTDG